MNPPANNASLNASSAVVLGLLAASGPQTTYDMMGYIELSVGFFWPFPSSQMYAETKRLEQAALIAGEQEDFGRRRRVYSITDAGRRALATWLHEPADKHTEIRDLGLLKLFFAEAVDDAPIAEIARHQIAQHEERLRQYSDITAAFADSTALSQRTIELGLAFEQAAIAFWTSIASDHGQPPQ